MPANPEANSAAAATHSSVEGTLLYPPGVPYPVRCPETAKILVVPPHFVGDAILMVPLLRQIKRQRPQSAVGIVVSPAAYDLLKHCPYVDTVYQLEKPQAPLWQRIQSDGYDRAVLLRPMLSDARRAHKARIPIRIGYRQQRVTKELSFAQGWYLTHVADVPPLDTAVHQVDHLLARFLPLLGLDVLPGPNPFELWPTEADRVEADRFFQGDRQSPVAVVHWTAASLNKGVDLPTLVPVLLDLAARGYRLLLSGPPDMASVYQTAWKPLLDQVQADWHLLAGRTTLPQLLAVLERTSVLISLDSAPVHMAAAVGTPAIVTVYGATNADRWAPWVTSPVKTEAVFLSLPCRPCSARVCDHNQCRTDITSQHLLQALNRVLR
jgi:heptosyltransferase II